MKAFKNLKPSTYMVFGAIIWGALVVFLLLQFVSNRLISFDEDQIITSQYPTVNAYLEAVEQTFDHLSPGQIQIIRVVDEGCVCNGASVGHWAQVQQQYESVSYREVLLDELSAEARALVPATPMAIITDKDGTLMYAGPFSDANYCTSENSFIDAYLNETLRQKFSPLAAVGCYCKTAH